tara:strand:- start:2158 stop:3486 length:1329 start_codon:yes stop_codon:yes gene_type:complete
LGNKSKKNTINKWGNFLFKSGIFFLPSAVSLSAVLLLISSIISIGLNPRKLISDRLNYLFYLFYVILIFSFLFHSYQLDDLALVSNTGGEEGIDLRIFWNPILSLLGLMNWIPLFLIYFGSQNYLLNAEARRNCTKYFIAGSLTVLVTGFGQYFFSWYGPFQIFNGFITWYQKPLESQFIGLTGLFSNQNYAGCWLNIIWPFTIATFMDKGLNNLKRVISFILLILTAFAIILTASRSAWIGMFLPLPFLYSLNIILWIIPIIILLIMPFLLYAFDLTPDILNFLIEKITPAGILKKLQPEFYSNYESSRINIYFFATKFLFLKPFFGWGAGSLGIYYFLYNQNFIGHSHSLPLDLAYNYGLPASLVFLTIVLLLLTLSFKNLETKKTESSFFYYERAWFASTLTLLASQLIDVQYYDAKISIAFWVLFAGIRNISNKYKIE